MQLQREMRKVSLLLYEMERASICYMRKIRCTALHTACMCSAGQSWQPLQAGKEDLLYTASEINSPSIVNPCSLETAATILLDFFLSLFFFSVFGFSLNVWFFFFFLFSHWSRKYMELKRRRFSDSHPDPSLLGC